MAQNYLSAIDLSRPFPDGSVAMTTETIYVINPNSTVAVTEGIDRACAPLRMAGGPRLECLTLAEGPPGIQTQRDVDTVIAPLLGLMGRLDAEASAFVIACFSDPGLHSAREATKKPVLGIMESGILTALTLGQRFGVIAILSSSVPRHLRMIHVARHLRADGADAVVMGCAGMAQYRDRVERAAGIPVVEPTQAAVAMAIGRVRLGW